MARKRSGSKRKTGKKAITARQKSARRKNIAVARSARKKGSGKKYDRKGFLNTLRSDIRSAREIKKMAGGRTGDYMPGGKHGPKRRSKAKMAAESRGLKPMSKSVKAKLIKASKKTRRVRPPSSGYVHYD
jgi:hypothetical protein